VAARRIRLDKIADRAPTLVRIELFQVKDAIHAERSKAILLFRRERTHRHIRSLADIAELVPIASHVFGHDVDARLGKEPLVPGRNAKRINSAGPSGQLCEVTE